MKINEIQNFFKNLFFNKNKVVITKKVKSWDEIPKGYTGIAEHANGTKYWYLNGKLHREDGPAYERANGTKFWYLNDKLHRIDGPACEYPNGDKEYLINGKEVTKEAQEVLYAMYKLKGML